MSAESGMTVDHIDGNTLNNTKKNLRICSQKENSQNVFAKKGYWYNKRDNHYVAQIQVYGKTIWSRGHATADEARFAYLELHKKYRGHMGSNHESCIS